MTYKTHREFAICFVLIANIIIYKLHLSHTGYYVNMIVMILCGKQGALFPDVDHDWKNVKEKTVINKAINSVIHAMGGKHRSVQTHSWDVWLISFIGALVVNGLISENNATVFILIISGFWCGWLSHLISDMMTSAGVYITCLNKNSKIAFVPKQANMALGLSIAFIITLIGLFVKYIINLQSLQFTGDIIIVAGVIFAIISVLLRDTKFNTGNEWENGVYKVVLVFNTVFTIYSLIFPMIDGQTEEILKIWMQ